MRNLFILVALLVFTFSTLKAEELSAKDLEALDNMSGTNEVKTVETNLTIKERDSETGIMLDDYHTLKDTSRLSALYHLNKNPMSATDVTSLELNYARRMGRTWLEFSYVQTSAALLELTDNNQTATGLTELQLEESSSTVTTFGAGLGYRSSLIQNLINSNQYFETVSAQITYNSLSESLIENSFTGYGLKADFGIHKRVSSSFHLGARMSYNMATVQREQQEMEVSSDASLNLSWMTFAIDGSLYF